MGRLSTTECTYLPTYLNLIITLQRYDHRQTTDCDWGVNPMSAVGRE